MGGSGWRGDCRDGCERKELSRLHSVFDLKGSAGNDKDWNIYLIWFLSSNQLGTSYNGILRMSTVSKRDKESENIIGESPKYRELKLSK